jgi:hypothetical protein
LEQNKNDRVRKAKNVGVCSAFWTRWGICNRPQAAIVDKKKKSTPQKAHPDKVTSSGVLETNLSRKGLHIWLYTAASSPRVQ